MQCHFVFGFELGMGSIDTILCVIMSNIPVSMVPTWMLCNLYTYAPYLPKLCGNLFMTLFTCTFSRSVNCQGISTEANKTEVLDIRRTQRTHQGYV